MKTPIKIRLLTWVTTAIMAFLVVALLFTLFTTIWWTPRMVPDIDTMEGVKNYTNSQQFKGGTYTYIYERDLENGAITEGFFLLSRDELFRFMPWDSVRYRINNADMENSQGSEIAQAFGKNETDIHDGKEAIPILVGHPGFSLDRETFFHHIKLESLYRLLVLIYLFVMMWYLRKFVTGLQNAAFFTDKNVRNLKIVAFLIILSPFFDFIWGRITAIEKSAPFQANLMSSYSPDFMFGTFLFGLILWVVAWCFGHGVTMQREQELTV